MGQQSAGEPLIVESTSAPMRTAADDSLTTGRTLLDDLAALVARATAAGDLALARALLDAQGASRGAQKGVVVDLAARRSKRR